MKIVLFIAPAWGMEMPPLGACLIKASVQHAGYQATVIDGNQFCWNRLQNHRWLWGKDQLSLWTSPSQYQERIEPLLLQCMQDLIQRIKAESADVIGFSLWDSNIHCANAMIEHIGEMLPGVVKVAGGPQTTFKEMRVKISKACDYYLVGEGEEALPEFLAWLSLKNPSQPLPEGFYSFRDEVHRDLPYRQIPDLNRLPPPDFSDVAHLNYASVGMPLIVSRSCLFKCRFCSDYVSMGSFRKLSGPRLHEQLSALYRSGVRSLWFNDLLINGIVAELIHAFKGLQLVGKRMEWIALATPNAQLSQESLNLLRLYGLKTLNLGLESGSNKVMRLMRKGFDKKQAGACLQRIHAAGINTQLNLIVGYPGETEEDFQETLEFLAVNRPFISGFTSVNTCILIPGSEVHSKREQLGLMLPENQDPSAWFSQDGNNPEVRSSRLMRLKHWILANGYAIYTSNETGV